jgi:hypothetical protein
VRPFGLINASAMFQSLMNTILQQYICKFVVFFDDILIYSSSWVEHLQHVKMVFDLMRANTFASSVRSVPLEVPA